MNRDWNNKPQGSWDPEPKGADEERAIQRGIDATMNAVIRERGYSPFGSFGSMAETPAPKGSGWTDPKPLESPGGQSTQALIERMVNAAQPHGSANPLNDGGKATKKE